MFVAHGGGLLSFNRECRTIYTDFSKDAPISLREAFCGALRKVFCLGTVINRSLPLCFSLYTIYGM